MRLIKYKCPKSKAHSPGSCLYDDKNECVNCGVSYDATHTIWYKALLKYYGIVPYEFRPKNLWYQFKCWAWHRYTTVKPRTLDHTWCDKSYLLHHLIFQVLVDFVEKEMYPAGKPGRVDWEYDFEHKEAHDKIMELYIWWTQDYKGDDFPFRLPNDEFEAIKNEAWKLESTNLALVRTRAKEVIDLAPWLWT